VYLRPGWFFKRETEQHLAKSSLWYMLITPFSLVLLWYCDHLRAVDLSLFVLLFGASPVPCRLFFGIAVAGFDKSTLPSVKLYASDLVGASLDACSCLRAPGHGRTSLILCCGPWAALPLGVCAAGPFVQAPPPLHLSIITLVAVAGVNSMSVYGIRRLLEKLDPEPKFCHGTVEHFSRWPL